MKNIKTIPFDASLRNHIQSEENHYQGRYKVQTRDGKPVKIICWDKKDFTFPIVALVEDLPGPLETILSFHQDGMCYPRGIESNNDLCLVDTWEPKFRLGDWITDDNGNSYYILNNSYNIFTLGDGYLAERYSSREQVFISFEDENKYHLWTIDDAKEGDVLTSYIGDMCIFKEMLSQDSFYSHCRLLKDSTEDGTSWVFTDTCCDMLFGPYFYKPSTLKEKDFFFHIMEASGYEWDKENKTLKKI